MLVYVDGMTEESTGGACRCVKVKRFVVGEGLESAGGDSDGDLERSSLRFGRCSDRDCGYCDCDSGREKSSSGERRERRAR